MNFGGVLGNSLEIKKVQRIMRLNCQIDYLHGCGYCRPPTVAVRFLISLHSCRASVHLDPRRLWLLFAPCFCHNFEVVARGDEWCFYHLHHFAWSPFSHWHPCLFKSPICSHFKPLNIPFLLPKILFFQIPMWLSLFHFFQPSYQMLPY